jgi:starvation-inducible DNA-binding protein
MSKSSKKQGKNIAVSTAAIGLSSKACQQLSVSLNDLLANYQVFYQNTRGFHWNIKGENFFELHLKFEELYTDLQVKIDEIAERILTLGHTPLHSFDDYSGISNIKAVKNCSNGREALTHILDGLRIILVMQRGLLLLSSDAGDEGTNALMSGYVTAQEKLVWMYSAYLG